MKLHLRYSFHYFFYDTIIPNGSWALASDLWIIGGGILNVSRAYTDSQL